MASATKLTKLRMDRLSGVDEGANETPGWILEKSKAVKADLEDFEKSITGLFGSLVGEDADLYFKDAPEEVVKAREELAKHISEDIEEVSDDEGVLAKFRKLFKSEDGDGDGAEDGDGDGAEDGDGDGDSDGDGDGDGAEDGDGDGDSDGDGDGDGAEVEKKADENRDELIKAIASAVKEELDPVREAVGKLADRTENLEKFTAQRAGLSGQEGGDDEGDGAGDDTGIAKALRVAIKTGHVDLT